MAKTITIGGKRYAYRYPPNSVRREVDGDVARYAIYINDDLYELCPLQTTEDEAEMRLQDIMREMGIEGKNKPLLLELY